MCCTVYIIFYSSERDLSPTKWSGFSGISHYKTSSFLREPRFDHGQMYTPVIHLVCRPPLAMSIVVETRDGASISLYHCETIPPVKGSSKLRFMRINQKIYPQEYLARMMVYNRHYERLVRTLIYIPRSALGLGIELRTNVPWIHASHPRLLYKHSKCIALIFLVFGYLAYGTRIIIPITYT